MSCMLGKKEKQKTNLQLKFYTWLGIEPRLAQALRSTVLHLLHWATEVRTESSFNSILEKLR